MLRIIGAILIISGGTLLGLLKSSVLKKRWDGISKILYSLRIMENEISYGKSSMDTIFEKIERLGGLKFSENKHENAGECFSEAVKGEELHLEKEEDEVLRRFCETLGTTDSIVQLKNIKTTIKSLEILEDEAKSGYRKYGKVYRNMGMLIGLLAVIVLM